MLTSTQLSQYLGRISFPNDNLHTVGSLEYLTSLQKYHLANVPFESLSLHYSKYRLLSLEQEDLYQKIVVRGMGGYCMENNTLFGILLRSLGYKLINVGARVSEATVGKSGGGYVGWYEPLPSPPPPAGRRIKIVNEPLICFLLQESHGQYRHNRGPKISSRCWIWRPCTLTSASTQFRAYLHGHCATVATIGI